MAGSGKASRNVTGRGGVVDDDAQDAALGKRLERETRLEERVGADLTAEIQLLGASARSGPGRYLSTGSPGVVAHSIHEPS